MLRIVLVSIDKVLIGQPNGDNTMLSETIEYKGYNINIYFDYCLESPFENEGLAQFALFHSRYDLPNNTSIDSDCFNSWGDMEAEIYRQYDVLECLTVSMYDHSGVHIYEGHPNCPWDSGRIGFVFLDKEEVRKWYNVKRISNKTKEKAVALMRAQLKTYASYVNGETYAYTVEDSQGEILDSMGGFIGSDHEESGLLENARSFIDYEVENSGVAA